MLKFLNKKRDIIDPRNDPYGKYNGNESICFSALDTASKFLENHNNSSARNCI